MILIYSPLKSLGVKKSTEILSNILKEHKILKVHSIFHLFLLKILNPHSILILSLSSIVLSFFFRKSLIFVHGYPEKSHYSSLRRSFILLAYYLSFKNSLGVIFVSKLTKNKFSSFYCKNKFVIHNIDKPIKRLNITPKKKLIYWGRVIPEKGLDKILNLFSILKDSDPNWEFEFWGYGKFPYINRLINSGASYKGSFKDISEIKSKSINLNGSFFISLNDNEPFGISYIEALMLGCIVVIPRYAGANEVLEGSGIIRYDSNVLRKIHEIFDLNNLCVYARVQDDRNNFKNFLKNEI